MGRDSATSLAPGFRFHPTDEELVSYYLKRKVSGKPFRLDPISVIDIYKSEPWDLPGKSKLKTRDLEWYFFSALDRKYGNSSRTNRATEKGYWKTTGKDRPVRHNATTVGMKKTLVYHIGRAPRGARTNWVMHEYKLTDEEMAKFSIVQDAFVLCRIFQKSGTGPKNGEQYGAPFIEEEWEANEELALVPRDEQVADELLGGGGLHVEGDDFNENVDEGILSESAPPPPFNFYYGETSNSIEQPDNFIEDDQKAAVGICETSELPDGQTLFVLPDECGLRDRLVKHEYLAESSNDADANAADEVDAGDVDGRYVLNEPFFSTSDNLSFSDELLLESNELSNPTESDPAAFDVLEEYLTFFDADGENEDMSFDPSEILGSDSSVPDQSVVSEVARDATEHASSCTQTADLRHDNEASSSSIPKPEDPKAESDIKYPFLKHTSHMLGSIPAPFSSQFTSKDAGIHLNSAPQASSSVRVTAGMIIIRNMALNGEEVNNLYGKNSDLNFIYLYGIIEGDIDSSQLLPTTGVHSSKSGPLMSRYFMYFFILFWVLILSVSFKVGSCIRSR
ncbi:NAC domain-containing protein 53-like [Cucurbita moschata]|uniref:NAC domain-containing protein 53-like n=1 Tax=Cucurbita moschata TaxID=3662 RepID=A0A6J1GY69_CUCMO|nr:NAC domain-containing protein 53-like [Cucurbita moschata]